MGEKKVTLNHESGLRFVARTGSGHDVVIDNAAGDAGARPTELLLASIAGCTAMDIVDILTKKRQAFDKYSVEVTGTQREKAPNVFLEITVLHIIEGGSVEAAAVARSIELSAGKYCTVSAQVAAGPCRISHRYTIKRPATEGSRATEESAEVMVTGPLKDVLAD
ncbi:MAG TPA: OsmC family protein [Candidatus Limnocylindrales bacterium]